MSIATLLALQVVLGVPDTAPASGLRFVPSPAPTAGYLLVTDAVPAVPSLLPDTGRPRAFVYSDGYATRLTIHQWTSWAMLPLFGAQYLVGQRLYRDGGEGGLRDTHTALATGIGGLFAVNTVTGGLNLWESRRDPNGRTRRWVHGVAMMAAGAGFLATAVTAPETEDGGLGGTEGDKGLHRTLAISSGSLALASWLLMLVWKD